MSIESFTPASLAPFSAWLNHNYRSYPVGTKVMYGQIGSLHEGAVLYSLLHLFNQFNKEND